MEESSDSSVCATIKGSPSSHRTKIRKTSHNKPAAKSPTPSSTTIKGSPWSYRTQIRETSHSKPAIPSPSNRIADRISDLPNTILQQILSLLPIDNAIRTNVLSKRWVFVWNSVPNLVFSHQPRLSSSDFASFVDKTLFLYHPLRVQKFFVDFQFKKPLNDRVDSWVRFAIAHEAEELCLNFDDGKDYVYNPTSTPDHYLLPVFFYSNDSVKELSLRFCDLIKPKGLDHRISWASLKTLSIAYTCLSNDSLEAVLLGSPVLAYLKLHYCDGFNFIDADFSGSLKELVVNGYWGPEHGPHHSSSLKINGSNLLSLTILGCLHTTNCVLQDVSSLVEANIGFHMRDKNGKSLQYLRGRTILRGILEKLQNVEKLSVATSCLQILSLCEGDGLSLPLSTRKTLTLNTRMYKLDLPGIASLLRSSPDLQNLTINMMPNASSSEIPKDFSSHNFDGEEYWKSANDLVIGLLLHLRSIEVFGFDARSSGSRLVLDLVQFLVKKAKVLEKMVIYPQRDSLYYSLASVDLLQKLILELKIMLSLIICPRASQNAVVMYKS